MICDMTYLGHLVTFRDLDLRSNFGVDLSRSKYTCSIRFDETHTMGTTIIAVTLKMKKLFVKNYFAQNSFFFTSVTCRG